VNVRRGDVVIVDFSRYNAGAGVRPALIVQNDRDNARLPKSIVVQVTGNLSRADEPTQFLIDQSHSDWSQSGLLHPSVVTCSNIATIENDDVTALLGSLSAVTMQQIDECLKEALAIH
jgi:mRNA-degrading endonuclease toxin of MazEF toxin-antitoxin module